MSAAESKREPVEPYVQVFRWIRDLPVIWDDTLTFGWWVKLLVLADAMWPSAAELPRGLPTKILSAIESTGQIDVLGTRFRAADIETRRDQINAKGKLAANIRWERERERQRQLADADAHAGASADAHAPAMPLSREHLSGAGLNGPQTNGDHQSAGETPPGVATEVRPGTVPHPTIERTSTPPPGTGSPRTPGRNGRVSRITDGDRATAHKLIADPQASPEAKREAQRLLDTHPNGAAT